MNEEQKVVSIIIPVYNMVGLMDRGIKSILNQTYPRLQIIAVDDGSTDDSLNELKSLGSGRSDFEVYTKKNGGLADARNFGLARANGDYVYFFDPDDYVETELISLCVECAEKNHSDVVVFNSFDVNPADGEIMSESKHGNHAYNAGSVAWNKLFSWKCWKNNFFPTGVRFEDTAVIPYIVAHASRVDLLDKSLYYYLKNRPGSLLTTAKTNSFFDKVSSDRALLSISRNLSGSNRTDVMRYIVSNVQNAILTDYEETKLISTDERDSVSSLLLQVIRESSLNVIRKCYANLILWAFSHKKYEILNAMKRWKG